jgi:2-haloacid dehalogenase
MDRRHFVKTVAGAIGGAAIPSNESRTGRAPLPSSRIRAVAFDGFVIFDPRSVEKRVEEQLPGKGAEFTTLWRTRQFEYCWLRTCGARYTDFWLLTDDALSYTAKSMKVSLTRAQHDALMDA